MIELDGSFGEGGGAIMRQALALSMHTGKAFTINNIRASRPQPGLKMQHLHALNTCQRLCNAEVKGNLIGSTEVYFKPGELKPGSIDVDIGTAGSITLLLQSLLLPCLFSEKRYKFRLTGGTDVKWSQPIDYFANVLLPYLKHFGDVGVELVRRGYYPKGNGIVKLEVEGKGKAEPLDLVERGQLLQIKGVSHASQDLEGVSDRQAENAEVILKHYKVPVNIRREYVKTDSTGSGITVWAVFGKGQTGFDNLLVLGGDCLGEPKKKAELVGEEAANALAREIDSSAVVDKYMADQLIPFLAVAGGSLRTSEVTNHARSNIYVAEKFLDAKFEIRGETISCQRKV